MTKIKLAIQKSGRLSEASKKLLRECGISLQNGKNKLLAPAVNFPLEILYLRDDDIPQYVEDGIADIGILGENVVLESRKSIETRMVLGFSKCRLSLAIPKEKIYTGLTFFQSKKIATSYPHILTTFFKENNIQSDIHKISGSVEIAPSIGLADAVCDIVSSGSTLFSNGLKEVEIVMKSEAVLVVNSNLNTAKSTILDKLLFRIQSVNNAKYNKYIILNAPNECIEEIVKLLPGMRSPTIVPLAQSNWSAIHSVVQEQRFWDVIDQLKFLGAEGILVVPIGKMIL